MRTAPSALVFLSLAVTVFAQEPKPFVHPLFADHMVLQRDKPVSVWGWASAGSNVEVRFAGRTATTMANDAGKWTVEIGPFAASSKSLTLTVRGSETREFTDVLVGDVWICSGQSNMEWPVAMSNNATEEIAAGDHPNIRLFTAPRRVAFQPQELVDGAWSVCAPNTVRNFSAVGYFFGRELNQELEIPIGLIHTSWGGTVAEAWTSGEALANLADFKEPVAELQKTAAAVASGEFDYEAQVAEWWEQNQIESEWAAAEVDHSTWKSMQVPTNWEAASVGLDNFDGIVWFRKEFDLPATWRGKDVVLSLGAVDDADTTYVNGHRVGGRALWTQAREYTVKASLLKPGKNVIAVCVYDGNGGGGLYDPNRDIAVMLADDKNESIGLKGTWYFKPGEPLADLSGIPPATQQQPECGHRALQWNARMFETLLHQRGDLVPGRVERRPRRSVRTASACHDRGLASPF